MGSLRHCSESTTKGTWLKKKKRSSKKDGMGATMPPSLHACPRDRGDAFTFFGSLKSKFNRRTGEGRRGCCSGGIRSSIARNSFARFPPEANPGRRGTTFEPRLEEWTGEKEGKLQKSFFRLQTTRKKTMEASQKCLIEQGPSSGGREVYDVLRHRGHTIAGVFLMIPFRNARPGGCGEELLSKSIEKN